MQAPVFVNSSFRTSSTWIWEKLRKLPHVTAYCEIFNPILETLSEQIVRDLRYDSWRSNHPACAPYFFEFMPLLRPESGIPGYDASMALGSFIPADGIDGTLSGAEQAHVAFLIQHCVAGGTQPVLTDTRTLGRARALKKAFGGQFVLIYRNVFHQWGSYCHLKAESGNDEFFGWFRETMAASTHDPFFRMLDDWFPNKQTSVFSEDLFARFLLMHLYLYAHNVDVSDLIIDVNAIAADSAVRRATEQALSAMVAAPVDLSDVHLSFQYSAFTVRRPRAFFDTIDQFTKLIAASPLLSPKAVAFLHKAKDEALSELERHEFYCREGRSIHLRQLDRISQSMAEQQKSMAERLHEAEVECARLRAALAEVTNERDRLARGAVA